MAGNGKEARSGFSLEFLLCLGKLSSLDAPSTFLSQVHMSAIETRTQEPASMDQQPSPFSSFWGKRTFGPGVLGSSHRTTPPRSMAGWTMTECQMLRAFDCGRVDYWLKFMLDLNNSKSSHLPLPCHGVRSWPRLSLGDLERTSGFATPLPRDASRVSIFHPKPYAYPGS